MDPFFLYRGERVLILANLMDAAYLEARITKTKGLIEAYEDAMLALATGAQTYKLDTGQTVQSVTKADLGSMRLVLDGLMNRCATMEARLNGSGVVQVIPGW